MSQVLHGGGKTTHAIALGHPFGMSGARIPLTLVHQLERPGGKHTGSQRSALASAWDWR